MKYGKANVSLFSCIILSISIIATQTSQATLPDSSTYSVADSFNKFNKNNSLFMVNVLRFSKSKTKLLSQNGIIETMKNSNYCLYDMCISKYERDTLIRIFYNQITSNTYRINNVQFTISEINHDNDLWYIKSSHGPLSCFIFKAGNFFLYIAGVNLDFSIVKQEQREIIDLLKGLNDNTNDYIVI